MGCDLNHFGVNKGGRFTLPFFFTFIASQDGSFREILIWTNLYNASHGVCFGGIECLFIVVPSLKRVCIDCENMPCWGGCPCHLVFSISCYKLWQWWFSGIVWNCILQHIGRYIFYRFFAIWSLSWCFDLLIKLRLQEIKQCLMKIFRILRHDCVLKLLQL